MEIYEIEFKGRRKEPYLNAMKVPIQVGDYVIVEMERGEHIGKVALKHEVPEPAQALRPILRLSSTEDQDRLIKNRLREKEAFGTCKTKILEHALEMKLVDVEYQFDGNKISFYFTADERIDFRDLVKSLAAIYRTRIDMRQIGARDETKRMCWIGSCGRPLCCGTFLDAFKPVTTQAVQHQHLSHNSSKLLGACGRLKCCLLYEEGYYEEAGKRFPKVGARVITHLGPGVVEKIDIIGDAITVTHDSGVTERLPRSMLGSGHCDGQKCHVDEHEPHEHRQYGHDDDHDHAVIHEVEAH